MPIDVVSVVAARKGINIDNILTEKTNRSIISDKQTVQLSTRFGKTFGTFMFNGDIKDCISIVFNGKQYDVQVLPYGTIGSFVNYAGNAYIYNEMLANTGEPFVLFTGYSDSITIVVEDHTLSQCTVEVETYDIENKEIPYINMPDGYSRKKIIKQAIIDTAEYEQEENAYLNIEFSDQFDSYDVYYDGTKYTGLKGTAFVDTDDWAGIYIGDPSLSNWFKEEQPAQSQYPFLVLFYPGEYYGYIFYNDYENTHKLGVTGDQQENVTIHPSFLPKGGFGYEFDDRKFIPADFSGEPYTSLLTFQMMGIKADYYRVPLGNINFDMFEAMVDDLQYKQTAKDGSIHKYLQHANWINSNGNYIINPTNSLCPDCFVVFNPLTFNGSTYGLSKLITDPGIYFAKHTNTSAMYQYATLEIEAAIIKNHTTYTIDPKFIPNGLPAVTTADNGKTLKVVDGKWAVV